MPPAARPTAAVYVFNGWHPCAERDRHFGAGWTEWDLVRAAKPHFEGHVPPGLALDGAYDDRDPAVWDRRIALARAHGVDVLLPGVFWSRGKKVFEAAMDSGYLACSRRDDVRFAVFWANRMPHRVLPLRTVDPAAPPRYRKVYSDPDDFTALIEDCADRYFARPNYWRLDGAPYISIFDATLFVRQLGPLRAAAAIARAKSRVGGLHLAAIDPENSLRPLLRELGFDSATHYVLLPEWKGPRIQDYAACAAARESGWDGLAAACSVPYFPSVSPGWDATPRATLYPKLRPHRYPWSPVVVGADPDRFRLHASRAASWTVSRHGPGAPLFVASWNEHSEGHALEPAAPFAASRLVALASALASRDRSLRSVHPD